MTSRSNRVLGCAGALAVGIGTLVAPGALAGPKPPGHSSTTTTSSTSSGVTTTNGFANYSVAETPGITCPSSTAGSNDCSNYAAEPAIRSDPAGNFYGSSENGLGGGTIAVKSIDNGAHYKTLVSPNGVSPFNNTGFAPGGGDTDLATATAKNGSGNYNVYVASLNLANVDVSTSTDGGTTWTLNPTSATIPVDDREWITAYGPSNVCISYHDILTYNIDVNCSSDGGTAFTQLGSAIDSAHSYLVGNNEIGNLTSSPDGSHIYQVFSGIGSASDSTLTTTTGNHAVWVGVSTDYGKTFTDYPVYINPDPKVDYGHQFVNISLDTAGNAYAVYSDNHNLYYSYSTTHGTSWSTTPVQVNSGNSATAIMPWSVAGSAGKLDVVWYGTSYYKAGDTPDNYPSNVAWNVYFAQNLTATTPGSGFTQTTASPVNHYGGVCESGISCTGNRDLYDDFGVAASPITGLASIIYSDDQYDPQGPNSSGCSSSANNTQSCDHTAIATQTTYGTPIN